MYTCVRGIHCFSVSMISFIIIIIIINVHVPDQYSEWSCIHVSEVSIVSLFLWYLLLLLLLMYMYQTSTVNGHVYMCQRYWLFLCFYDIFVLSNKLFLFDTLVFIKCDTSLVVRLVPFFRGYIYFYIKVSKSSFILYFVSFTMSNSATFWYISQVTRGLV